MAAATRDSHEAPRLTDTGCHHPESELVNTGTAAAAPVWCRMCGSICERGVWVAPRSLVLPGWHCARCASFNGVAKELRTECRSCGAPFNETSHES